MTLRFSIPGKIIGVNQGWRAVDGRVLKSKEGREYQARVALLAKAAMLGVGMREPFVAARVVLVAWDTRLDVGNIEKLISDGMEDSRVFENDSAIQTLVVSKHISQGEKRPRVDVCVSEADENEDALFAFLGIV